MQTAERLLLRPEQGADALGMSRAAFYKLLSSGAVPSITIGRSRRIPVASLEAWVARQLAEQVPGG